MSLMWLYLSLLISIVNSELILNNEFVSELQKTVIESKQIAESCTNPLVKFLDSVVSNEWQLWQLKMLDASSFPIPTGILAGNIVDLGNFDECLSIEENFNDSNETMYGKFCDVVIQIPTNILNNVVNKVTNVTIISKFSQMISEKWEKESKPDTPSERIVNVASGNPIVTLSLCIPSGCNEEDFNYILNKILNISDIGVGNCQTKFLNSDFETGDYLFIAFLVLILILMIASTVFDIYIEKTKKRRPHIAYFAFSVYSNGKKLISSSKNPNTLPCLNGIRFLSMVWVIFGHTYYSRMYTPIINTFSVDEWSKRIMAMTLLGATVSVDSFFVLGGLVMVYVFMMAHEKGIKFNVLLYYIHRYIRLTPALAVVMLCHMTILRFFGSGPLWPKIMYYLEVNCTKYWWSVLLYVQNYVNPNEQCIGQTWYLSVDMQLFLISPLILYPLSRWPKWTLKILYLGVIMGVVAPFIVGYNYKLPGLITVALASPEYMPKYYINTYIRFGPWIVGIILGYFVHIRHENRKLNNLLKIWWFNLLGWILSIAVLTAVVYGANNLLLHEYDRVESSIYIGMHRVAWSVALSWIIYACIMGHGGIINWFLSLTPFQIMSRLTYSMYLTHLSFQFIRVATVRVPERFDDFDIIHVFFGDFIYAVCIAVIITLAFESPMITVEKILLGNVSKKTESKENILEAAKTEKNHHAV